MTPEKKKAVLEFLSQFENSIFTYTDVNDDGCTIINGDCKEVLFLQKSIELSVNAKLQTAFGRNHEQVAPAETI